MSGAEFKAKGLAAKIAVFILVVVALASVGGPAAAVFDEPYLDSAADYTYVADLAEGTIESRIELTVIADRPNRTVDDGIYQYYFTGYNLLIPSEAENLRVVDSSGAELQFKREGTEGLSDVLSIEFRRNIYYRQEARITVEFTLTAGEAGSNNIVRINPAIVSFVAWTSPALEDATVTVILPAGYEDQSTGSDSFQVQRDGAEQRLIATDIDPENYFTVVSAVNENALEIDVIDLPEGVALSTESAAGRVLVFSWPGDEGWRNHVIEGVDAALPVLLDLVDQPWPIEDELTIMESFSPYLNGYAGWYDSGTDVIEVGDEQDDHVLYHELAHVWLHGDLFAHRWITEGLADLFAAETVAALGGERSEPSPTSTSDTETSRLLSFELLKQEEEQWAYAASWSLMESIADEIGLEGLAEVIDAATDRRISYVGDGEPETVRTAVDWRRFLDLVENVQEVDQGPVTDLTKDWVVYEESPGQDKSELFEQRREARARYFDLVEAGNGWAAPYEVRNAMMVWQFPEAESLMDDAEGALAKRDELLDVIKPTRAELPNNLEELYEGADTRAEELSAALDETAEAGNEVRQAYDHSTAEQSLLQQIGLIGTDLEAETDEAATAFSAGRLHQAITEADEVDALVAEASRNGLLRVAAALALTVAVLAGAWFLILRPRRLRRRDQRAEQFSRSFPPQ